MKKWLIIGGALLVGGCTPHIYEFSLNELDNQSSTRNGDRIMVEAYLLSQDADGLAAGFPAVAGNSDVDRAVPVANGCPTEDTTNLPLRFREPLPDVATLDGRRVVLSGVYHSENTWLKLPSANVMVGYGGYLDDVTVESTYPDSCTKWTHTEDGLLR
jgi:hypothetical protein